MTHRLVRQLRYSLRLLARSPLFTLTAVASLAIGIGANVAIFSVANALLFAPTAGVRDMAGLVDIGRTRNGSGFDTVSYPTFQDVRDRNSVFDGVFAFRLEPQPFSLGADEGALRVYGHQVSASYFDVLGVTPAAGTFFHSSDEEVGEPLRRVVLSHAFWTRQFNAAPSTIGSELVLNGDTFVVAGIAPGGFQGTTVLAPDIWVPLTAHGRAMISAATMRSRENVFLVMGARLKKDTSLAQAQEQMHAISATLAAEFPEVYAGRGLRVARASRVPGEIGEFVKPFVGVLMGVVGLVLLVACTNLAGLLLSRATDRTREVSVRLALGAPRRAIVGMLLTETLLVFGLGALAGIGVASVMAQGLASILTSLPMPAAVDLAIDWRVLTFAMALTLLTGLLTGLAPAWQTARRNVAGDLRKESQTTPQRQRLRRAFIAAQLAFCLVLVIGAGLFAQALRNATNIDPGFEVDAIDVATLELALGGYDEARSPAVAEEIRVRLAALPGVHSVGTAAKVPLDGGGLGLGALRPAGTTGFDAMIDADWNVVSPEFLSTLGTPVVRGRQFSAADTAATPHVAIVNERFANTVWPGQAAIGQVLEAGDFRPGRGADNRRLTVVGVARDVKYRWIGEQPRNFIYVPLAQNPMRTVHYFVRRANEAAGAPSLQPAVRQVLKSFDANLPLVRFASFRSYADLGLLPQRIAASVAGALGVVALLLAAIGVYGVTAFAVASRTREIGLRMALGADERRVTRDILRQGVRLTLIGGGVGLAAAALIAPLTSDLLFGVSPLDPLTFAGMTALLAAIGLAATYVPARRAARVDPLVALRAE